MYQQGLVLRRKGVGIGGEEVKIGKWGERWRVGWFPRTNRNKMMWLAPKYRLKRQQAAKNTYL
jgi:hypothetical protein